MKDTIRGKDVNGFNDDASIVSNLSVQFLVKTSFCSTQNELATTSFHVDKAIQVELLDAIAEDHNPFYATRTFLCTQYERNDICEAQTQRTLVFLKLPRKRQQVTSFAVPVQF